MTNRIDKAKQGGLKDKLKFLASDSLVYGSIQAVSKFFAIFLTPILTRLLSKEEFGQLDSISNFMPLFIAIGILGMDSAVARFYYDTDDENEKKNIISTGLIIQLVVTLFISSGLAMLAKQTSEFYLSTDELYFYILLASGIILSTSIYRFFQNLLKWTFARNQFMIISIGLMTVQFTTSIVLLTVFNLGVKSVFIGQLSAYTLFAAVGAFFCRKHLKFPAHFNNLFPFLKFGFPYMLVALIPAILPSFDRYFITNNLGLEYVAYYGIAYRVISLLQLPITGFKSAWSPFVYATYKDKDGHSTYIKVAKYYALALCLIAICITSFSNIIIIILGSQSYLLAQELILPLSFAIIIEAMAWILGIGIGLSKKTYFTTIGSTISLITAVGIIYYLSVEYGLIGIAYGVLISKLTYTLLISYFSRRSYQVNFEYAKLLIIYGIGFIVAFLNKDIDLGNWKELGQVMITVPVFIFIAWKFFLDQNERIQLNLQLNKMKAKLPF